MASILLSTTAKTLFCTRKCYWSQGMDTTETGTTQPEAYKNWDKSLCLKLHPSSGRRSTLTTQPPPAIDSSTAPASSLYILPLRYQRFCQPCPHWTGAPQAGFGHVSPRRSQGARAVGVSLSQPPVQAQTRPATPNSQ